MYIIWILKIQEIGFLFAAFCKSKSKSKSKKKLFIVGTL